MRILGRFLDGVSDMLKFDLLLRSAERRAKLLRATSGEVAGVSKGISVERAALCARVVIGVSMKGSLSRKGGLEGYAVVERGVSGGGADML